MGVLAGVAGVFFWFSLDKQEDKLNSIGTDHAAQIAAGGDEKA
ncbi:hypothetical protein MPER_12901 [Moniliophthora perniciosa FA553]|nr:hypothetical protein MPER_12901 [Moniliophthora perniciosa FA553]